MFKGVGILSAACVAHGMTGRFGVDSCCYPMKAWNYDAKTGAAYPAGIFTCWKATCAPEGSWAGPLGIGSSSCHGLTNVNGICRSSQPSPTPIPVVQPPANGGIPSGGGYVSTGTPPVIVGSSGGSTNFSLGASPWLLIGLAGVVALLAFRKK